MEDALSYNIEDRDGIIIVHLSGNISNITREDFQKLINNISKRNNIIINMGEVILVTSAGLEALKNVCIEARKNRRRVILLGVKESLIKMIEILDAYDYFIFVETIEEAQMKLSYYL